MPLAPGFNMFLATDRNEHALTIRAMEGVGVKPDLGHLCGRRAEGGAAQLGPGPDKTRIEDAVRGAGCSNPRSTPIQVLKRAAGHDCRTGSAAAEPIRITPSLRWERATRAQLPRLQEMLHSMGEFLAPSPSPLRKSGHRVVMALI